MADATNSNEEEKRMNQQLEAMKPLHERISALLQKAPRAARVTTDEHFLKMMEMELRAIIAWLRGLLALGDLRALDTCVRCILDEYERPPPRHAVAVLLHRAARCCRRTTTPGPTDWHIRFQRIALFFADLANHPLSYKHLLLVGDDADDTAARTYREFPDRLKQLLIYMVSRFPQGYRFDKHRLTWRWASEGLNSSDDTDYRVKEAERYFSDLVDREVITSAANYGHKPAAVDDCYWQVNPNMLKFLASKSAKVGIVNSAATRDNASTNVPRWLSLHQPDPELPTVLEKMDLSQTRSLAVSGAVKGVHLNKFVYSRVLDLEGWENLNDKNFLFICSRMLMLRYLSVRNTRVTRLPPVIKEMIYLEVLDVSQTRIRELPSEVRKLGWLRALDMRSTQIRQLPEQIVELGNLLHLLIGGDGIYPDETAAKIPEGIVRARSLRTLATADLSECSASFVEALGWLRFLEVLAIRWSFHQCTDGRYQAALRSSIGKWEQLKSLTIHCGLGCSMEFLGSWSFRPPGKLETFKVTTGSFFVVPKWIQVLVHLSFLQITVCKLGTNNLKILGELPKLQCLVLGLDFLPEEAIVIPSEGFSRLRTFSIDCLVLWLTFTQGAMPSLTYLDLEICSVPPKQEIVLSGISNLEKLLEVVVRYNKLYNNSSSVKKTVEAVKKAVVEHRKRDRINLVINGIQQIVQAETVDEETVRGTTKEIRSEIQSVGEIKSEAQMP